MLKEMEGLFSKVPASEEWSRHPTRKYVQPMRETAGRAVNYLANATLG
jgi:hypothetical protein